MTLSFTQTINGKPNYFIENIWNGLLYGNHGEYHYSYNLSLEQYRAKFGNDWDGHPDNKLPPKLHTIREYRKTKTGARAAKQWKAGDDIHPCINPRSPNYFQFAPVIKCVSVQTIEIKRTPIISGVNEVQVFIDGKNFSYKKWDSLAKNDGFGSAAEFFAYFNKDFTGVIIHWTDLKY